ncbi:MAG: TIGR02678 family protein [Bacillota bacterium]
MSNSSERFKEEKQSCVQALLNRYWITKARDPDLFQAIRNRYDELREWFQEHCGFTLLVTRQFAKLEKVPGKAQSWMGFEEFYQPRDYALFTFCLWYMEGKSENEQFLLTDLVQEVRDHLLNGQVELDWTLYDHRLSMARALKKLKELGVLIAVDGEEWEWVRGNSEKNVLYECSALARYVLRRFPQDLTAYTTIEALGEGIYPETPEGQLKRRKHLVYRRLLQEPAVYDREWTEEERYYVLTQRRSILDQLGNTCGLEGERYREGLLFFYPHPSGEMELFPTAKSITDITLLLGGEVRKLLAREDTHIYVDAEGRIPLSVVELEGILMRIRERNQEFWSQQHRQATTAELAGELVEHLEEWGLAGRKGDQTVWLEPALARWNGDYENQSKED